jgi:hypothetical protein
VAFRSETAKHGGLEQQIPPHAAVITFGFPIRSYVPTTQTGVGKISVFAPKDFFMGIIPSCVPTLTFSDYIVPYGL